MCNPPLYVFLLYHNKRPEKRPEPHHILLLLVRTPLINAPALMPQRLTARTLRKGLSSVEPGIAAVRQPYNSRAIRPGCRLLRSRLGCVSLGLHLCSFLLRGYLVSVVPPHPPVLLKVPFSKSPSQSPKTITSLIANHLRAGSNRFVSADSAVLKAILPVYTSHNLPRRARNCSQAATFDIPRLVPISFTFRRWTTPVPPKRALRWTTT